jgi:hypothetical protein
MTVALSTAAVRAAPLRNPVARCADAGILHAGGTYYLSGVGLPGQVIWSTDLVHWQGPRQVFDPQVHWARDSDLQTGIREVHAPCFARINGRVHLYWNGIGHAVADSPFGPFVEPDPDARFDRDIDPFLFTDEDGRLYFYTVKFDRGNVLYGQRLESPDALADTAVRLFGARDGTWETRDGNRIAEGPEVFRYCDRYYLLYAANGTWIENGHYAIGCAEADSPLGFGEGSRYPGPVLESNEHALDARGRILVQRGYLGGGEWDYTSQQPGEGWDRPGFEPGPGWQRGLGGFGFPNRPQSRVNWVGTEWNSHEVWLRHEFTCQEPVGPEVRLKLRAVADIDVAINGVPAFSCSGWTGPGLFPVPADALAVLNRSDTAVLTVHARQSRPDTAYVDLALIDFGTTPPDDLVWNPGQPNIVLGPNGFERYLVYFALWDQGPHCQGINRVRFVDRRLTVAGPTGTNPPDHTRAPTAPTFSDHFNSHRIDGLNSAGHAGWEYRDGWWFTLDGEARQTAFPWQPQPVPVAKAIARTAPARHYRVQADVRTLPTTADGTAGLVGWFRDHHTWLLFLMAADGRQVRWLLSRDGVRSEGALDLPESLDPNRVHRLRLDRQASRWQLFVDHCRITPRQGLELATVEPGRPGLAALGAEAAFDGFVHTVGWEEWDDTVQDWHTTGEGNATDALVTGDGLEVEAVTAPVYLRKGVPLPAYEFEAHVRFPEEPENTVAVVVPAYVDSRTWLRVELPADESVVVVRECLNGTERPAQRVNLDHWAPLHERVLTVAASPGDTAKLTAQETDTYMDAVELVYADAGPWHAPDSVALRLGRSSIPLSRTPSASTGTRVFQAAVEGLAPPSMTAVADRQPGVQSAPRLISARAHVTRAKGRTVTCTRTDGNLVLRIDGRLALTLPDRLPAATPALGVLHGRVVFTRTPLFGR